MLNTFLRFESANFCTEQTCVEESTCFNSDPEYTTVLPAIQGDEIKFIVAKSDVTFYAAEHLEICIADECGNVIEASGTIEEGDTQLFVTALVPGDLANGLYTFVFRRNLQIDLISITPETSPGACDAIVTYEIPSAPAQVFEWSLDGITYQSSSTFTGVCQEPITVYVRVVGDTCDSGEVDFDLTPLDCSLYQGWTLQQFQDAGIRLFQMYDCLLSDIQP